MALKKLDKDWQYELRDGFPHDVRTYIDFRQRAYPALTPDTGLDTYSRIGDVEDGRIAYWPMNEGFGDVAHNDTTKDLSSSGNDMELEGGGDGPQWVTGYKQKWAIELESANSEYLTAGADVLDIERTDKRSISGVFNLTSNNVVIISKRDDSSPNSGWEVAVDSSGRVVFSLVNTVTTNHLEARTDDAFNDGFDHWFTITYDGSSSSAGVALLIDGQNRSASTVLNTLSATTVNSINLHIGTRNAQGLYFNGNIQQLQIHNRVLTFYEVRILHGHLDAGVVGNWRLDESTGVTAEDDSVESNDGTLTGGPSWIAGASSVVPRVLSFDGIDDYVTMGNFLSFERTAIFSIRAKIKTTDTGNTVIASKQDSAAPFRGYRFTVNNGALTFNLANDNSPSNELEVHAATSVNDGTEHDVVVTYAGGSVPGSVFFYVDGAAQTTVTDTNTLSATTITTAPLQVGARNGVDLFFDGTIRHVQIWSHVLTVGDVKNLYNGVEPANRPGSHGLTGGYIENLVSLPSTFTMRIVFQALFRYDYAPGWDPMIFYWNYDGDQYFYLYYSAYHAKFTIQYNDGGAGAFLRSAQLDDGTTYQNFNGTLWVMDLTMDLTTGDTTGSTMYLQRASAATAWSAASSVKSTDFPVMNIRRDIGGNLGEFAIYQIRLFPNFVATAAQVAADYKDVLNEEIVWNFNGHGTAFTRCNVSNDVDANGFSLRRQHSGIREPYGVNEAHFKLQSDSGEYADDQYAAFDAPNQVYNGTVDQAYMKQRPRVEIETWRANTFEPIFTGRVDGGRFARKSWIDDISMVEVVAVDVTAEIRARTAKQSQTFEDYKLSDPFTPATSLLHALVKEGTQGRLTNMIPDSSFENAGAISLNWTLSGAGASLAKVADTKVHGAQVAEMTSGGGAACHIICDILFTGRRKLNVGKSYTFVVLYEQQVSGSQQNIVIYERDASGVNATATTQVGGNNPPSKGYAAFSVSHTIKDRDSDRLRLELRLDQSSQTVRYDLVALVEGDFGTQWEQPWHTVNSDDGAAGAYSVDNADEGTFDKVGFDADYVNITHPWYDLAGGEDVWRSIKSLADATIARYVGAGAAGEFRFYARLAAGYGDPLKMLTLKETESANRKLESKIEERAGNMVLVQGVRITKQSVEQLLWSGGRSGTWDMEDTTTFKETIANGAAFPDLTDFPQFWAEFDLEVREATDARTIDRTLRARTYYGHRTYVTNREFTIPGRPALNLDFKHKSYEVIGVKSPRLAWNATGGTLTQETFDVTTRGGAAHIVLRNSSGGNVDIWSLDVFGLPVVQISGKDGFVHDDFRDEDHIAANGEQLIAVGNDMVVTAAQVGDIADFLWKDSGRSGKHVRKGIWEGLFFFLEASEWIGVDIGAAGTQENIDETASVLRITFEVNNNVGRTMVTTLEEEENWKPDSSAAVRFLVSGGQTRTPIPDTIIVAPSTWAGIANQYCDGTADDVQINAALQMASDRYSGGTVQVVPGTYYLAATVTMQSNVSLVGSGPVTIFEKNGNFASITISGKNSTTIERIRFTRDSGDTNSTAYISGESSCNDLVIVDCRFDDSYWNAVDIDTCTEVRVEGCTFVQPRDRGIELTSCSGQVIKNIIKGDGSTEGAATLYGIRLVTCPKVRVELNQIIDLKATALTGIIIQSSSDRATVVNNTIRNLRAINQRCYGIQIAAGCDQVEVRDNVIEDVGGWPTSGTDPHGIAISVSSADDVFIANNRMLNCFQGIFVALAATISRTRINNNYGINNGQLIDNGQCETTTAPMLTPETTPDSSHVTFARDSDQAYEGTYGFKATKSIAAGTAGYVRLNDNHTNTDLHGLIAGTDYRLELRLYIPSGGILNTEITIEIEHYASGSWSGSTVQPAAMYDSFQELVLTHTIVAGATGASINIDLASAAELNEHLWVDVLRFRVNGITSPHNHQIIDYGTNTVVNINSWQ